MENVNHKDLLDKLKRESTMPLSDEALETLLSIAEPETFAAGSYIIAPREVNKNLYILVDGITRLAYKNDDANEVTIGFAAAATLTLSPLGWLDGRPAYYYFVACTECKMLRIAYEDVISVTSRSPELAMWLLGVALCQLAGMEIKQQSRGVASKDNYRQISKKEYQEIFRKLSIIIPDVNNVVSDKVMASYLGVHPVYFSRMKREMIAEERQANKEAREQLEAQRKHHEEADRRLREMGIEPDAD